MNPIIKFTTLFGLLAVELAIGLSRGTSATLAAVFFAISARLRLPVLLRDADRELAGRLLTLPRSFATRAAFGRPFFFGA